MLEKLEQAIKFCKEHDVDKKLIDSCVLALLLSDNNITTKDYNKIINKYYKKGDK